MLNDFQKQQKVRPFILTTGLLSIIWLVLAWIIAYFYVSNQVTKAYTLAEKDARLAMNQFHSGLHRTMNLLQTIPIFISNDEEIQKTLLVLNENKDLDNMSRETREKYLRQFPKLIKTNKELYDVANDISVISSFWIMRKDGTTISSSNAGLPESFIGTNFKDRDYFQEAISGTTGKQYVMGRRSGISGFIISVPIRVGKEIVGVVAEKVDLSYLHSWVGTLNGFIVDQNGVIIQTNNSEYELMALPNATVNNLSRTERQALYMQTEFKTFNLTPLSINSDTKLYKLDNENTPYYVVSVTMKGHKLNLMTITPCPEFLEKKQKIWTLFALLFLIGISIITSSSILIFYLKNQITKKNLREKQNLIQHLTSHDSLTGLYSRSQIDRFINQYVLTASKNKTLFAVMFMDVDLFKDINDSFGHEVGDNILREIANRIQSTIKKTDIALRRGGDEFIILLNDIRDPEEIANIAVRLQEHIKEPFIINNLSLTLSISIGIAIYPIDGDSASLLLRHADTALYHVKAKGRADYSFYNEQMSNDLAARKALEADMLRALELNEFYLLYQPQYSHVAGGITGCEALIRWRHPAKGIIPPIDFIPAAEQSGFINQLGKWIINEACKQYKQWYKNLNVSIPIAVNLSAVQFQHSNLVETVRNAIKTYDIPPNALELEVTESMLMVDTDRATRIMQELKGLGTRISIDDFGTGYSSMAYLKKFDADTLKIDRTFVFDMESNSNNRAIVSAIINMAKNLDYQVIAEGVETQEQYDLLIKMDCSAIQGYWFSRPIPPDEFETLYKTTNKIDI